MAIEGSLQDVNLADICQLLAMGRKIGCLTITDRSNFGYIYFEEGRVTYASVLNRPDRLGDLLVKNGVITRDELQRAMEAQAEEESGRLGEMLVRQNALTEDELHEYITVQIEEAVYHLFTWDRGSFYFDPDQTPDDGIFRVSIPTESLLLEGARRVDEWSLIEKKIPSFDIVFSVVKDPRETDTGDDFELTGEQRKLLPLLDGERTVEEIVRDSGMVEFDVGKALYGLLQAGFIDQAGTRPEAAASGDERVAEHVELGVAFYRSGMLEDATREFEAALELEPDNKRVLFRLASIALREGRPEQALVRLESIDGEGSASYGVLRNRAVALEILHRFDEALETLDRALELRPEDPEATLARAVVLLKTGRVDDALEALRGYRTSPRVRTPSALYYAYTVLASGMADDLDYAVQVGREGLGHYPECGPLLVNTGAILERRGEIDAATALYGRALHAPSPPAQAHKRLGDVAHVRGNLDQARAHYEKAVRLSPRLGDDVYVRLGTLAYNDEDYDVARLLWQRALDLNPTNDVVRSHLGLLDPVE